MIRWFLNRLILACSAFLCGAFVGASASAVPLAMELTARLVPLVGDPVSDKVLVARSTDGGGRGQAEVQLDNAVARTTGTFDLKTIGDYVLGFSPDINHELGFLGDTVWASKTHFHMLINAHHSGGVGGGGFIRERGTERYAAFAIAPNSASGFAPPDTVDLIYNVEFYSESMPLDVENNLFPPFGTGPNLDFRGEFHQVISQINLGHLLIVDLDAMGVALGEAWAFQQSYNMFNEGLSGDSAFIDIDPVAGFAAGVPEPATAALLGLGAGILLWRRRHQGRAAAVH